MKNLPKGAVIIFFTLQSDDDGVSFFATRRDAEKTRNRWINLGANGVGQVEKHEILAEGFECRNI